MRSGTTKEKLFAFLDELGKRAEGPGRVYLVGGATALLLGVRDVTIDIDLKLDPEPKAVFESIAVLKDMLDVNVELAAPDQFLPAIPGWQDRSEFITKVGQVEFFHYDFYGQALSKILRGHDKDLDDAGALVRLGKVHPTRLIDYFRQIKPNLTRFPSIRAEAFEENVNRFIASLGAV